jgi:hypothetical protein
MIPQLSPPFPEFLPDHVDDEPPLSLSKLNYRTQRTLIKFFQELPSPETHDDHLSHRGTDSLAISRSESFEQDGGNYEEADEVNGTQAETDGDTETVPEEDEGPKTIMIERPRSRPKLVFMGQRR